MELITDPKITNLTQLAIIKLEANNSFTVSSILQGRK